MDISSFNRISIPLVRRAYPQLIAEKLTSVQPLRDSTIPLEGYAAIIERTDDGLILSLDITEPDIECVILESILEEGNSFQGAYSATRTEVEFENGTKRIGRFKIFREQNRTFVLRWE